MGALATEVFVSHNGGHSFSLANPEPDRPRRRSGHGGPDDPAARDVRAGGDVAGACRSADSSWSTPLERHDEGAGLTDLAFVDPLHGAFVYCPAPFALDYFGPTGHRGGRST